MSENLPAPENGTIEFANKFLSGLVDASEKAAKAALIASAPFFGWPGISQLTDYILNRMAEAFKNVILTNADFLIIDTQTARKYHAYMEELAVLKAAQLTEKPDDDTEALSKAQDALARLIRFGN